MTELLSDNYFFKLAVLFLLPRLCSFVLLFILTRHIIMRELQIHRLERVRKWLDYRAGCIKEILNLRKESILGSQYCKKRLPSQIGYEPYTKLL